MNRLLAAFLLLVPQLAFGWPTEDQWIGIQKDGALVEDDVSPGSEADVIGDGVVPLVSWYAETDTVWFGIRVSTSSYDSATDVVGVGIRTTGSQHVVTALTGVGSSGVWDTPCEWGATAVTLDGRTHGVQISDEGDGTTFLEIAVDASVFQSWLVAPNESFEILALHGSPLTSGEWGLDFGGVDEASGTWSCNAAWSDAVVADTDLDGLFDPGEIWIGSNLADADSDDDGRLDGEESLLDVDEDGVPGLLDCDADDDGIADGTEVGLTEVKSADTDVSREMSEGRACFQPDADPTSQTNPEMQDTDMGGLADGFEDWNFDGKLDLLEANPLDPEDDADRDGDTIADVIEGKDSDYDDDGYKDYKDTDSDGDGIPDSVEFVYDTDGDESPDYIDRDADGDGIKDIYEGTDDFDEDGIMNFRDVDSDGDAKLDADEGRGDDDCDGLLNYLDPDDGENCNDKSPGTDTGDFNAGDWDRSESYREGQVGGGCATIGSSGSLWLGVLAGLLLAIRRFPWVFFVLIGSVSAAQGQSTSVDAVRFAPPVTNGDWTRLHPAELLPEGTFVVSMSTNYARNPFVFHGANGDSKNAPLLSDVLTAHLMTGFSFGRVQFGLQTPFVLHHAGILAGSETPLGDMGLSVGLGFGGRRNWNAGVWLTASAPTGDGSAGLGAGRPEVGGRVGFQWRTEAFRFLLNTGFQSGTRAEVAGLRVGPAFTWGMGANWDAVSWLRLAFELEGEVWLNNALSGEKAQPGALPTEWAIVTGFRPLSGLQITLSGGSRIGRGLGAPDVRGVLGIHWAPKFYHPERNPSRYDTDNDGIVDAKDRCIDQPEDLNGIRDNDGCPDAGGMVSVNFEIVDVGGRLVAGARVDMLAGETVGAWLAADGTVGRALNPGEYDIRVEAEGFLPVSSTIVIPKADVHGVRITLIAPQERGRVILRLVDAQAKPITGAQVRVLGTDIQMTSKEDGLLQFNLPPGAYEVTVTTAQGGILTRPLTLEPGTTGDWSIVLPSSKQQDSGPGPIQLNAKVFFPLKQSVLTVQAYQTLDALVNTLNTRPFIRKVGINGHSDSGQEASLAQGLAEKRAKVVYEYLVNAGIEPARLRTKGYGYGLPLQEGSSEEIQGTNRRVEFRILEYGAQ